MISGTNEQLQEQLEYTLLKPDFHSWWISKYNLTLQKNDMQQDSILNWKNATETYGMLQTAFGA